VRWDPSGERLLPAKEKTWPAVRQLLEQSATACGRREYLDEQVDGVERPLMRLTFETAVKGGEERVVRVIAEQSHARGDLLNDTLHRAVHAYLRETMARIVRRRDFIDRDGGPQSEIVVYWEEQKVSPSQQLKNLDVALGCRDLLQHEAAWFGLTERSHEYLSVGFRAAQRLRRFQGFCSEVEVSANVIPVLMPGPDLLQVIVPFALRVASRRGRRPVHDRDKALRAVLKVFADLAGTDDPKAWRARCDEPMGPGAEFVRHIEAIFEIELMPPGSTHAPRRAYGPFAGGRASHRP